MHYIMLDTSGREDDAFVCFDGPVLDSAGKRIQWNAFREGLAPPPDLAAEVVLLADPECVGRKLGGVLGNHRDWLVARKDLKETIDRFRTPNDRIDCIPAVIAEPQGRVLSRDYFIISPRGVLACLDQRLSNAFWRDAERTSGTVEDVVLDENALAHHPAIFRLKEQPERILIRKDILDAYAASGAEDLNIRGRSAYGSRSEEIRQLQLGQRLMKCIEEDAVEAAQEFLDQGADPRLPMGRMQVHPLRWVAQHGAARCVALLLERGCPVDEGDSYGTPLVVAMRFHNLDIARSLLTKGADPNLPSGRTGELPVLATNNAAMLRTLLQHGADPGVRFHGSSTGPDGTLFLEAVAEGRDDIVDLLLAHGLDIHAHGEWEWCSALGIVRLNVRRLIEYLKTASSADDAEDLKKSIVTWLQRGERLAAAGLGSEPEEDEILRWLRSVDLEEIERVRAAFQDLGTAAAARRPDFLQRVLEALGGADAVTDANAVAAVVDAVLKRKPIKKSPHYSRLFIEVCARQRTIEEHAESVFGDPTWSRDTDESGLVESFADGDHDQLAGLCACLDDAVFARTEEWRTCFDALCATIERIDRYPEELGRLARKAFIRARPDCAAIRTRIKALDR